MAKFAISRFRQYARNITQAASTSQNPAAMARAQQVTSQAYKPRELGTGAEGTATLHMMPQASQGGALTPTVRKEFNPNAPLASPTMIDRRVALGPELNKTKDFAQFYGHGQTDAGRRFIDSEFIPGKVAPGADISKAQASIDRSLRSKGMQAGMGHLAAKDIRAENLGVNPKTGKTVALDYMPMKRQETLDSRYARMHDINPTAPLPTGQGAALFPNREMDFADPGRINQSKHEGRMAEKMKSDPKSVLPPKGNATPEPAKPQTVAARPSLLPAQPVAGPSVFGSLNEPTQAGVLPKVLPPPAPPR